MIQLRSLLSESASNLTLNDIWSGATLNFGDTQSGTKSALFQIQQRLLAKLPKSETMGYIPNGHFGKRTAELIGVLWNRQFPNPENVKIGAKTLEKLGFKQPVATSTNEKLSLPVQIIATTLVAEAGGEGKTGMQAVANVLQNRSKRRGSTPATEALKRKQFSMWNSHTVSGKSIAYVMDIYNVKESPLWSHAVYLAKNIAGLRDVTGGATHYYNPKKVKPAWGKGAPTWKSTTTLGNHTFGRETSLSWAK